LDSWVRPFLAMAKLRQRKATIVERYLMMHSMIEHQSFGVKPARSLAQSGDAGGAHNEAVLRWFVLIVALRLDPAAARMTPNQGDKGPSEWMTDFGRIP
jgi:hypothetical protein